VGRRRAGRGRVPARLLRDLPRARRGARRNVDRLPVDQHRGVPPIDEAARIAVEAVRRSLGGHPSIELVRFVCFCAKDLSVYEGLLSASVS